MRYLRRPYGPDGSNRMQVPGWMLEGIEQVGSGRYALPDWGRCDRGCTYQPVPRDKLTGHVPKGDGHVWGVRRALPVADNAKRLEFA